LQSAPGLALHVAGVFGEADGKGATGALLVALLEFLQRLNLRVDQGVHGIHNERSDTVRRGRAAQERIHDG
jgi:hypothetical protein